MITCIYLKSLLIHSLFQAFSKLGVSAKIGDCKKGRDLRSALLICLRLL